MKFNDENVYKGTSILYSVDSSHKSKGLSELGKKRRKIYIPIYKHITIVGTNLEKKNKSRQVMHSIKTKKT